MTDDIPEGLVVIHSMADFIYSFSFIPLSSFVEGFGQTSTY
ncbi:hypothetical protein [Pseudomaricurvus alkylphenolicus]|jgi:hypothetical protein|nr:hypothetical protein [Pseudomaricurvus alkylphenolicus]